MVLRLCESCIPSRSAPGGPLEPDPQSSVGGQKLIFPGDLVEQVMVLSLDLKPKEFFCPEVDPKAGMSAVFRFETVGPEVTDSERNKQGADLGNDARRI